MKNPFNKRDSANDIFLSLIYQCFRELEFDESILNRWIDQDNVIDNRTDSIIAIDFSQSITKRKRHHEMSLEYSSSQQSCFERSSIKINWKVQSVNQDNLATWPDVMNLIHSAIRIFVTETILTITFLTTPSSNDDPIRWIITIIFILYLLFFITINNLTFISFLLFIIPLSIY